MRIDGKRIVKRLLALALAIGLDVQAQPMTVGELLDQGGKKLTKEQMSTLIPGSTSSGVVANVPSRKSTVTFYADKTSKGSTEAVSGGGNVRGTFGTWSIDEQGNLCSEIRTTARGEAKHCTAWFGLGDKYYTAKSAERNDIIYLREFRK